MVCSLSFHTISLCTMDLMLTFLYMVVLCPRPPTQKPLASAARCHFRGGACPSRGCCCIPLHPPTLHELVEEIPDSCVRLGEPLDSGVVAWLSSTNRGLCSRADPSERAAFLSRDLLQFTSRGGIHLALLTAPAPAPAPVTSPPRVPEASFPLLLLSSAAQQDSRSSNFLFTTVRGGRGGDSSVVVVVVWKQRLSPQRRGLYWDPLAA